MLERELGAAGCDPRNQARTLFIVVLLTSHPQAADLRHAEKQRLQAVVEKIHTYWALDR